MGQCFGLRGGQQPLRGNRRFEYTPQKSWKYKDAHVMNQFKALSMESEGEDEGGLNIKTHAVSSDSEEEVFTTQPRRSQHLVFSEQANNNQEEEELDDVQFHQRTTVINKGFQLLQDEENESPVLQRPQDEDKMQLINDTDD